MSGKFDPDRKDRIPSIINLGMMDSTYGDYVEFDEAVRETIKMLEKLKEDVQKKGASIEITGVIDAYISELRYKI